MMTARCPEPNEWTGFLDGEITQNRAEVLREHAAHCQRCASELAIQKTLISRLAAPLPEVPSPYAAAQILRRLDEGPSPVPRRWLPNLGWRAGAPLLAAISAAMLVVMIRAPATEEDGFTARGGKATELRRTVGVELYQAGSPPRRLAQGEAISANTPLLASYRNLEASGPVYLMVFAVDSKNTVHWLYPAYRDADENPMALLLERQDQETLLPESVVLEAPAEGALRIVSLASPVKVSVSQIERLGPAERTKGRLQERWPDASIEERELQLRGASH